MEEGTEIRGPSKWKTPPAASTVVLADALCKDMDALTSSLLNDS